MNYDDHHHYHHHDHPSPIHHSRILSHEYRFPVWSLGPISNQVQVQVELELFIHARCRGGIGVIDIGSPRLAIRRRFSCSCHHPLGFTMEYGDGQYQNEATEMNGKMARLRPSCPNNINRQIASPPTLTSPELRIRRSLSNHHVSIRLKLWCGLSVWRATSELGCRRLGVAITG